MLSPSSSKPTLYLMEKIRSIPLKLKARQECPLSLLVYQNATPPKMIDKLQHVSSFNIA